MSSANDVFRLLEQSKRLQNSRARKRGSYIVLREWIDRLDSRWEFRCFVFDGRVTAISQYDWTTKYPEVWGDDVRCAQVGAAIVHFVNESCLPRLITPTGCTEWIVDVCRTHDEQWRVVEVNSFGADLNVGGCLYHWELDYDLIYRKDGEATIRFLSDGGICVVFIFLPFISIISISLYLSLPHVIDVETDTLVVKELLLLP